MHFSTHVLGNFPNCLAISWNALEILAILQLPRHFWKCLITTNPCNTCINGIKNIGVTLDIPVFARNTPMGKIVRSHKNGFGLARSYQTLTSTQRSDAPPFAVCKRATWRQGTVSYRVAIFHFLKLLAKNENVWSIMLFCCLVWTLTKKLLFTPVLSKS